MPHAPAPAAHLVTYFNIYLSESASRIQQPATRTRATTHTHCARMPHTQPQAHLLLCVCVLQGMPAVSLRCRGESREGGVAH